MITLFDLSNELFACYNCYNVKLIAIMGQAKNIKRTANTLIYPFCIARIAEKLVLINLGFAGICKWVEIGINETKWLIHCG
jgi:hypothetical protein